MTQDSFTADDRLIRALELRSRPVPCAEGRILFNQGEKPDGVYFLLSGEAALIMESASGHIVLCHRALAGSILGLPAVVGNEVYTMSAIVRKSSSLGFVSRADFEDLIREDPTVYPYVLEILAADVRAARESIFEHSPGKLQ